MPTIDLYSGFDPHAAQQEIWDCDKRFIVADCGRRFGKTEFCRLRAGKNAAEGKRFGYFTLKNGTMEQVWDDVKFWLKPIIKPNGKSEQYHRLEYVNGGIGEFWSLENEDAGLSRKYHEAIFDEAAIVRSARAWTRNVRPTLTDWKGRAYFFSTPRGLNWFWELFKRGAEPRWPNWAAFQFPTSSNPFIDPEEIEEARRELPDRTFRQEYLAEFLSNETAVFRNLDKVNTATAQDAPIPGHTYFMGIDLARVEDFSVIDIIDGTTNELVYQDRSRNIALASQTHRILALDAKFNPMVIHIEKNSFGLGVYEELAARLGSRVVGFNTTNISKMAMVDALALAFEHETLRILNDEHLIDELMAFAPTQLPGGGVRYSAPDGQHDDTVMALCLCWWAAKQNMAGEVAYYRW